MLSLQTQANSVSSTHQKLHSHTHKHTNTQTVQATTATAHNAGFSATSFKDVDLVDRQDGITAAGLDRLKSV